MKNAFAPVAALLLAFTTPLVMPAQVTDKKKEDLVVLSPFVVRSEKDYGYRASNAITATGIGTPIKDIPANINVITADFLNDKGIGELRHAVNNVSSANSDNRDRNRNAINIRGFEALVQQDGTSGSFSELENVSRIEIIKGPSAVFHGVVRPGGVINVIKNEPSFTPSGYVKARYGSYDYAKIEARATGPLGSDRLAYSVFASYRDQNRRPDYTFDRVKFGSGGLKWEPMKAFSTLLDFEVKDERYEFIHSLPIAHPAYIAAVDAGLVPYRQAQRTWLDNNPLYGPNVPLGQIFVTNRMFPRENFNPMGPDSPSTQKARYLRSRSTLAINDSLNLMLLVASNRSRDSIIEHNTFRPVAGQRPGELIFDSRFQQTDSDTENFITKFEAAYEAKFLGAEHRLLAGAQDQWNKAASRTLNGPLVPWNPLTGPIRRGQAELASLFPSGIPALPARKKSKARSYYLTDQAALFSQRLRVLAGGRYTESTSNAGRMQAETTPQVGVLVQATPLVGFYANYAETFEPNFIVDGAGRQQDPITGEGYEAGLKVDAFDSRLSGSLAVYRVERANIPRRDFPLEALTGIVPSYVLGGLERTEGAELDFTYSPVRNYQLVFSYTWSWEHVTVESTGDVRQVGVGLSNVPEHVANLWNKYTFVSGALKGFSIGAGLKASSSARLHPSWDVAVIGRSYLTIDAMLDYETKLAGKTVKATLNIENLTSERYNQGVYLLSDPIAAYFSVRMDF